MNAHTHSKNGIWSKSNSIKMFFIRFDAAARRKSLLVRLQLFSGTEKMCVIADSLIGLLSKLNLGGTEWHCHQPNQANDEEPLWLESISSIL